MIDTLSAGLTSFIVITLAELGDKSQLVCMTLAASYRALPVIMGACLAFASLNLLAVLFGSLIAAWIPEFWLALIVAALFALFGLQSLLFSDDDDEDSTPQRSNHGIFITAFVMIFVAEFGDKTQLAVAGLSSSYPALAVWAGATLALVILTVIAVLVGNKLLQRLPLTTLHRFSGILFLCLAGLSLYQAFR